jgi:hypothetical protein
MTKATKAKAIKATAKTKASNISRFLLLAFSFLMICNTANANLFSFSSEKQATGWDSSDIKDITRKEKQLNPEVLSLALKAYASAKEQGVNISRPIITIIDYSLPSKAKRMWVLDLAQKRVLFNSLVAHGKYSGDDFYASNFSNASGSLASSLGLFLTGETYDGHNGYTLKIKGLEAGFNDRAESRTIVMHGAWYVTEEIARERGMVGRSWGCPAVEPKKAVPIINTIKDGTLLFAYYPESKWLKKSKYLNYRT